MLHAINTKIKKYFRPQKVILADDNESLSKLRSVINPYKNVMVITGKNSYEASGSKNLISKILDGCQITIFNNFNVNPDIDEIKIGYETAKKIKPELIIAIGGGSVIDAAKIIHMMFSSNLNHEMILIACQDEMYKHKKVPLIAIPTTAGTGSESTHFAVLYKNEKKYSVSSPKMLPEIVYLDSKLCMSNSSYQNACSGFDALAQAIESYWSKSSNIISRHYALKSLDIIIENFQNAVNFNKSRGYHLSRMLLASNYAGKAINITKTTGPHALSYGITKKLNLPHGHAVAITLGAFFLLHNKQYHGVKNELKSFKKINGHLIKKTGTDVSSFLYSLMKEFDMEYDLDRLKIDNQMIDMFVENVNLERMTNHPIKLNKYQLTEIFSLIPKNELH